MEKKTSTNKENNIKEEINMKELGKKVTETLIQMNKKTENKNEGEIKMFEESKGEFEISREVKLSKIENYEIEQRGALKEVSVWHLDAYADDVYIARCEFEKEDGHTLELIIEDFYLDDLNEKINVLRLIKKLDKNIRKIKITWNNKIRLYKGRKDAKVEELEVKVIKRKIR